MRIEFWSDFACPYCYIAEVRLRRALRDLGVEQDVAVIMRSFELDPAAGRDVQDTTPNRFARKYGLSLDAANAQIERISRMGRDEGIDFRYATANYANMLDAHRVAKYGAERGHGEISEKLFAAYFTSNLNLADHETLMRIAEGVGLPSEGIRDVLTSDRYTDDVRKDEMEAARMGITGVPYFYMDKKTAIGGALPYGLLRQTIADLVAQEDQSPLPASANMCGPDGCHV